MNKTAVLSDSFYGITLSISDISPEPPENIPPILFSYFTSTPVHNHIACCKPKTVATVTSFLCFHPLHALSSLISSIYNRTQPLGVTLGICPTHPSPPLHRRYSLPLLCFIFNLINGPPSSLSTTAASVGGDTVL